MGTKKNIMVGASYLAIAAIAVGGTLAFLDDSTPTTTNVIMTDGKVDIVQIEQQRVDDKENQTVLEDFEQCKQMLPAIYDGTSIPFAAESEWVVPGDQAWKVVEDNDNVVDKFVTVKNTGDIPAYVRTVIAFESGCVAADTKLHVVHNGTNVGEEIGEWEWVENVTIDGKKFDIGVCTYQKALLPNETTIPSLKQVYLNKSLTAEEIEELYGDSCEILVMSQACQVESSKTAKEVLDNAFQPITATSHPWVDYKVSEDVNADNAKDALTEDKSTIIVNLTEDITYDVAAWAANSMGGESTKNIIINGNGHTITFNNTDSDWNNIATTNDAVLTINDAHITNSGYNNGPWNRHDINFDCPVVLNDVTSDKAIALKDAGTFNNVTISDANASDTYALWIQPNGQTVTLDGCTIDMIDCSDGRGIKIDEQYVTNPAKVTLNVSDTTFKTEGKSAIIVKSAAGADVILDNIDISGVADDTTNAVWVDEASPAYYDLVTVTGGTKAQETE